MKKKKDNTKTDFKKVRIHLEKKKKSETSHFWYQLLYIHVAFICDNIHWYISPTNLSVESLHLNTQFDIQE